MRRTTHFYVLVASTLVLLQGMRSEYAICNQKREILPERDTDDRNIDYQLHDIKRQNLSSVIIPTTYQLVDHYYTPSASISHRQISRYTARNGDLNRNELIRNIEAVSTRRQEQNNKSSRDPYFRNEEISRTMGVTANRDNRLIDTDRRHRHTERRAALSSNRIIRVRTVRYRYEDTRNERTTPRSITNTRECDDVQHCMRIENTRWNRNIGTRTSDGRLNKLRTHATTTVPNEQRRSRNNARLEERRLKHTYDRRNKDENRRFTLTRRANSLDKRQTEASANLQRYRRIAINNHRRLSLNERSAKSSMMQRQQTSQSTSETLNRQTRFDGNSAIIREGSDRERTGANVRNYNIRRELVDSHSKQTMVSTRRTQMRRAMETRLSTGEIQRAATIRSNNLQNTVTIRDDRREHKQENKRIVGSTQRDTRNKQGVRVSRRIRDATRAEREEIRERRKVSREINNIRLETRDRDQSNEIRSRVIIREARSESRRRIVSDLRISPHSRRVDTRGSRRLRHVRRDNNERETDFQARSSRRYAANSNQDRENPGVTSRDISSRKTAKRRQTSTYQEGNTLDDKMTRIRENRSSNRYHVIGIRSQYTLNDQDREIEHDYISKHERYQRRQERQDIRQRLNSATRQLGKRRDMHPLKEDSFGKRRDASTLYYKAVTDRRTNMALYQSGVEQKLQHGHKHDVAYEETSSLSSGFYTMIQSMDHTTVARTLMVGFVGIMGRSIWQKQG